MIQLQKLVHGEPNWDVKVNDVIESLNNMGGVTPSDVSDEGLVWLNGARNGQATWYRTTPIGGGHKIVELAFEVTGISANAWESKDFLRIPDNIKTTGGAIQVSQGAHYVTLNGTTLSIVSGDNDGLKDNSSTYGRFMYIS